MDSEADRAPGPARRMAPRPGAGAQTLSRAHGEPSSACGVEALAGLGRSRGAPPYRDPTDAPVAHRGSAALAVSDGVAGGVPQGAFVACGSPVPAVQAHRDSDST